MKSLEQLLEDICVHDPEQWENETGPKGWFAVSTPDDSIVAYFLREADAFRFRLDYINRILNP